MLLLALELEELIKNQNNIKLLEPVLEVLECDLVSPEGDKWRLEVLKQVQESGEDRLYERIKPAIEELLYTNMN